MANTNHQNNRKFHTIYQTTNLVNNKVYIGAHSTDDINDSYIGSGTNINRAIEKYGRESFTKTVLCVFKTPSEMFAKEKEIVTPEFLKKANVYNIVEGGYGGYNKGSTGLKHIHHPGTQERCAVHPNALDKMLANGWELGFLKSWVEGKIYVHKDGKKKVIEISKLDAFLSEGWSRGIPVSPTKGKAWIYNPVLNEYSMCDIEELNEKLSNGWIKKKWGPIKKGAMWVNNGKKNLRIDKEELKNYINDGWIKGMLTTRWNN
jgi:hypothetical protein